MSYVGTEHCISIAYSKQENCLVERTNKEINRNTTSLFFDKLIKDNWRNDSTIKQNDINHAEITIWLNANTSKKNEEGDETRLVSDVTDDFTEFSDGSHVLLEHVTWPKDRLHTKRTGTLKISF